MLEIEIIKKEIRPSYGSQKIVITAQVNYTSENGYEDIYIVEGEIEIRGFEASICFTNIIDQLTKDNEDTKTKDAFLDILNDQAS